ncbi:MAG: hypothetical protein JXR91_13950, partial [Deltaproteobacteria bacterium]|nr:hypothetical protein [Deltaproteobacteria bacterium]
AKKIILRALEKDPAKRHESMLDFQINIATLKSRFKHGTHYSLPSLDVVTLKKSIAPPPPDSSSRAHKPVAAKPHKRKRANVKADSATMFADSKDTFSNSMTAPQSRAVKIADNTYFVGVRNNTRIENNSYLRIFKGNNTKISLLIDPGSSAGFDKIKSNISEVIGSIENLNYIFLTDHDSVSLGNLAKIQELNPSVITICSEDTWLHASSLGHGSSNKYISIQSVPGNQLMFNTGHAVQFIKADFCHSRGSAMMFDPENATLFSGSLFSGTATTKELFCNNDCLLGINLYHQLYMPGRRALMRTIKNVENLTIPPKLLAPRHGTIIRHENIKMITEQIASLRIGSDLLEYNERNPKTLTIANKIVTEYGRITGKKPSVELIEKIQPDHNTIFDVQEPGRIVGFRVDGLRAIESMIYQAEQSITPELVSQLKFALAEIKNDLRTVRA